MRARVGSASTDRSEATEESLIGLSLFISGFTTVGSYLMFAAPAIAWSTTDRASAPHLLAEVVATAGLVLLIFALVRTDRSHLAGPAVGAYIGAAYFFTSSTSFANPAITIGRAFTDTFAGIAPASVLPYIAAQLIGGALGWMLVRLLFPAASPAPLPTDQRTSAARP